ncbi:MAG: aspartate--tRNA(Asn) ligase [Spirochaetia bacterium]
MRILADDVSKHIGKEITVKGWVHRIRDLGKVCFIILRDRSGKVQLVAEESPDFPVETVVSVTGTVRENDKAPRGAEIQIQTLEVMAEAAADLPVPVNQDPEKIGLEALLDNRMIALRNPKIRSIFTLQSDIIRYFSEYMRSQGFYEIKTSKLIGSGTEGGTGLFSVEYFENKVYLAQSPQFYKQAMVASGMERVFEVGAAYRAEKHDTPRHLNEYVSLDVEMAFIEDENDLMDLETGILAAIFAGIKTNNQKELDLWGAQVPAPEKTAAIPRISHDDAKKIISNTQGKRVFEINPEGERILCDWAQENHGIDAVFVYAFPRKKRPFYTYPEGLKTKSFDLLFRGLEITTGGRRINEYAMLKETLPKFGMTEEGLGPYAHIFKYGCPPHGGFAIGLERITQKILGLQNVKEASIFPRDRKRIAP